MHRLLAPFRLVIRVAQRFHYERLAQTAASLSFATLLGMVPMIAVAVALISRFPFAADMGITIEKFLLANLLPDKAGAVVTKYLGQFAHRVERITLIGVGVLAVTALMQMLTIEHAFNAIWKIRRKRPFLRRLAMHLITLLIGPLVFGASLLATSYVASVSFGLVNDPGPASEALLASVPFVFTTAMFALLYWGVPNRVVPVFHATFGGLIAALGFVAMQHLFSAYIANFSAYTIMYGAFAAAPIFMIWLYLSWTVILVGALLVAELPNSVHP